ncbi:MAG: hypothetical protein JKX97_04955, partial [Candidatus Lindowbacteria bacterium]|nr:hypothetical protein [Candidatus Lindowbacteria bacterium]
IQSKQKTGLDDFPKPLKKSSESFQGEIEAVKKTSIREKAVPKAKPGRADIMIAMSSVKIPTSALNILQATNQFSGIEEEDQDRITKMKEELISRY